MATEQRLTNESETLKIKTPCARIVVDGTAEKPYYSIVWFDPVTEEYYLGYSSYYLKYVFNWLAECFEIVDAPTIEARPVVHGRWENVTETIVYSPDHRCTFTHTAETCSACKARVGFIGGKLYLYDAQCPNCGAKMDGGAE